MKRETKIQVLGNTLIFLTVAGIFFTLLIISVIIPWLGRLADKPLYWVFLALITGAITLYIKHLIDLYSE